MHYISHFIQINTIKMEGQKCAVSENMCQENIFLLWFSVSMVIILFIVMTVALFYYHVSKNKISSLKKSIHDNNAAFKKSLDDIKSSIPEELKCPVCWNRRGQHFLLRPCNHIFCNYCSSVVAESTKKCPVCRSSVTKREHIYM